LPQQTHNYCLLIVSKVAVRFRYYRIKGLVHPKIKISPQVILGVYDNLISDEYNHSNIKKKRFGYSKLYNGSDQHFYDGQMHFYGFQNCHSLPL